MKLPTSAMSFGFAASCLALALASTALGQQPAPYAAPVTPTSAQLRSADLADFNGDGRIDIVVANESDPSAQVLLGDGYGNFAVAGSQVFPVSALDVVARDFNGDGKPDAVITRGNLMQVLVGDGLGGLALGPTVATGSQPRAIAVGDLDNDADLDLFSANVNGGNVTVARRNNTTFTYTGLAPIAVGGQPIDVAVGDVTGDGRLDVVIADRLATVGQPNGRIAIYRGLVAGGFVLHATFNLTGFFGELASIDLADLDGDLDLDLLAGAGAGIAIPILQGAGGTYVVGAIVGSTPLVPGRPGLSDLDEDGRPDLLLYENLGLVARLNNGAGAFGAAGPQTILPFGMAVTLTGRIDGDAHVDALVGMAEAGALVTLRGTGVGTFEVPTGIFTSPFDYFGTLATADLDNDADLDLVRARLSQNSLWHLETFINAGGFAPTPSATQIASVSNVMAFGDLTGDGLVDLVSGDDFFGPANVQLFTNTGGSFAAGQPIGFSVGSGILTDIVLKDMNADGLLDAVVSTTSPKRVSVFIATITGWQETATKLTGSFASDSIDVGDINADGFLDVVAGNPYMFMVAFLGDGAGGLGPEQFVPMVAGLDMRLVDLDVDGDLDILGIRNSSNGAESEVGLATALNNGAGTFATSQLMQLGVPTFQNVSVLDENGDTKPDVIVNAGSSVLIAHGDGAGGFTTPIAFFPGQTTLGLTAGAIDAAPGVDIFVQRAGEAAVHQVMKHCQGGAGRYGHGCVGSGGFSPELSLTGCVGAAQGVQFQIERAVGGAPAVLLFGLGTAIVPFSSGCTLQLATVLPASIVLPLAGVGAANGSIIVNAVIPSPLASGLHVTMQAACGDASQPAGFTVTNPIDVVTQ